MNKPQLIVPTVGRKVWFRPNGATALLGAQFTQNDKDQPFDATVIYVWNDRQVNLVVTDHVGIPFPLGSVPLRQADDPVPEVGYYCEWMPFQVNRSKRELEPYRWEDVVLNRTFNEAGTDSLGFVVSMRDGKEFRGSVRCTDYDDFRQKALAECNRQRLEAA